MSHRYRVHPSPDQLINLEDDASVTSMGSSHSRSRQRRHSWAANNAPTEKSPKPSTPHNTPNPSNKIASPRSSGAPRYRGSFDLSQQTTSLLSNHPTPIKRQGSFKRQSSGKFTDRSNDDNSKGDNSRGPLQKSASKKSLLKRSNSMKKGKKVTFRNPVVEPTPSIFSSPETSYMSPRGDNSFVDYTDKSKTPSSPTNKKKKKKKRAGLEDNSLSCCLPMCCIS